MKLTVNENHVLENFPTTPEYFEMLLAMFQNYFSGNQIYENINISDVLKRDMKLRFNYYKQIYDLIQSYWNELKEILEVFKISQDVTIPGELFALFLKNEADIAKKYVNENLNNRVFRDLYEAWHEYQKCLNGADSKTLLKLIKKLQKKLKHRNDENEMILQLIGSIVPIEANKEIENKSFLLHDSAIRMIRNNRSKF